MPHNVETKADTHFANETLFIEKLPSNNGSQGPFNWRNGQNPSHLTKSESYQKSGSQIATPTTVLRNQRKQFCLFEGNTTL